MAVWLSIDSLADFIYLIDIGVHFRTAYLGELSDILRQKDAKKASVLLNEKTLLRTDSNAPNLAFKN